MLSEQRRLGNVTIRDIAREAEVSLSTVSRVVNNSAHVRADKRERVLEVIERTQYRPNLVARGLKKSQTNTIAMVIADGNNEYFGSMMKAVESVLRKENYNIFFCNTMSEKEIEYGYLRMMRERQVDGFVINATGMNDDYISQISEEIPTVLLHRRVIDHPFHGDFIDADFASISSELVDLLLNAGHRDIGVICGPGYLSSHRERYLKIDQALSKVGVKMRPGHPWFFEGPLTEQFGYESSRALLEMENHPTALVITHSFTTLGALRYFREHGVHVPNDISIVSPCDVQQADLLYVKPVHAQADAWTIGERCGSLLLDRIRKRNDIVNREVIYSLRIADGDSIKRRNGK